MKCIIYILNTTKLMNLSRKLLENKRYFVRFQIIIKYHYIIDKIEIVIINIFFV